MDERAAREGQQGLRRALAFRFGVPVEAVLIHRVLDRLGEVGLQLAGRDGPNRSGTAPVQAVLVVERLTDLTHHPQPVGLVAGLQGRIHRERRFELGQLQGLAQAQQLHSVAQQIQGAAVVELPADAVQEDGCGGRP
jgi:hypothetical protein